MKIKEISFSNFRSHISTVLKDLGKLVIILGPNGSGKSGLCDGISYAVTGTCRGVDEAGRGFEALLPPVQEGGKPVVGVVTMSTDQGLVNRMVGQGPKSAAQEKITSTLKLERAALKCAMRSQFFLDMDAKEQEAILRALVAVDVTAAQVEKAIPKPVLEAISERVEALLSMDGVLAAYKAAFDWRTSLKKMTFNMPAAPAEVQYAGRSTEGATIEDIQEMHKEASADVARAALAQKNEAHRASMQKESQILNDRLIALRKQIEPLPALPELQNAALLLEKEADTENAARQERFEASRKAAGAASAAEAMIGRLQKTMQDVASMSAKRAKCDRCQQHIDKLQVRHIVDDLAEQVKAQEKVAKKAREDAKKLDDGGLLNGKAQEKLIEVRRQMEQVRLIRAEGKQVKERKAVVDANLQEIGGGGADAEEYQALVQAREAIQAQLTYRQMVSQAQKARADHEVKLEMVEAAVKALGPGGPVRALHMGGGFPELLKEISGISEVLGVGEVHVATSPKWVVTVNGRNAELLSASERFRSSLAFAAVIAKRTGVNMLCLDGADILDDDNRAALIPLVEGLGLDQVIVTATSTNKGEPWENWTTIRLENVEGRTMVDVLQEVA